MRVVTKRGTTVPVSWNGHVSASCLPEADVNARCYPQYGNCPAIQLACIESSMEVVELLLKQGAEARDEDESQQTMLHKVVVSCRMDILDWLKDPQRESIM